MRLALIIAAFALLGGCTARPIILNPSFTPHETPLMTPRGSPGSEPSASLGNFGCTLPVTLPAGSTAQTHVNDIRVAGHDGSDRIVWQFDGDLPEVDLRQGIPPFTTDPADQPLPVDGNAFLVITFRGASLGGADGSATYEGPTDFDPLLAELWQVRLAGDFEAVLTFVLGLVDPPCFDLFTLEGPSRVVLDLAGQ